MSGAVSETEPVTVGEVARWAYHRLQVSVTHPGGDGGFLHQRHQRARDFRKVEKVRNLQAPEDQPATFELRASDGVVFDVQVTRRES